MFVDLQGPAGLLEGILEVPDVPRFAAIVCHPHPLHGGTMHSHATFRHARALGAIGGATLRFHFRGVGRSAGEYDDGRGELDDAAAALRYLAAQAPSLPLWAAGFSFGARAALGLALIDPSVVAVHAIGVAVRNFDHSFAQAVHVPIAVVQGAGDEFGTPAEVEEVLGPHPGPLSIRVVPDSGHLFTDTKVTLDRLEAEARAAGTWLMEQTGLPPVPTVG